MVGRFLNRLSAGAGRGESNPQGPKPADFETFYGHS